jgi:hypothetical protein
VLIIAFFLRERSEQVEDERVNVPAGVPEGGRGLTQIKAPSARIAFMATFFDAQSGDNSDYSEAVAAEPDGDHRCEFEAGVDVAMQSASLPRAPLPP